MIAWDAEERSPPLDDPSGASFFERRLVAARARVRRNARGRTSPPPADGLFRCVLAEMMTRMPVYLCPSCSKEFTDKTHYSRHLARTTPCAPVIIDLPEAKKTCTYRCRFCGRAFSAASSLTRHIKNACKVAPQAMGAETSTRAAAQEEASLAQSTINK